MLMISLGHPGHYHGMSAETTIDGMYVTLARAEDHHDTIVRFRREICAGIGLDPDGPTVAPLPFATYLFACDGDPRLPVGMVELFLYDQAFATFEDAIYSQAADLAAIAPLHALAHLRSIYIAPNYRRSRLFQHLCAAMAITAHELGARFITAGTGADNHDILALHRTAGMQPLGSYEVDGAPQRLSLLDLAPIVRRVQRMRTASFMRIDPTLLQTLRQRRR